MNPSQSILDGVPSPFSGPEQTENTFQQQFQSWKQAPTPESNTTILSAVQPTIDTALSSYVGKNPTPVMRSRARLMALNALKTYDPGRGNVRTHLLSQLQGLRRLSAKENNIINIPEQVGLDFQKLEQAENELRDRLNRDPADDEVADFTGLSVRRIRKIRNFHQPLAEGVTATTADADNAPTELASTMPGNSSSTDAWLDFVYDDLGPVDKLVMDMTLGRNGRRRASTQDIARRLNITPGAVSQRAAKIQAMMDRRYTHNF
jgi:DNA-directed RNA polymerase specialized sigma subunit